MDRTDFEQKKDTYLTRAFMFGPLIVVVLFFAIQLIPFSSGDEQVADANSEDETKQTSETENLKVEDAVTESEVKLIARSAIVKNLRTGEVLYRKNSEEARPLASLTKIMTALAATENLEEDQVVSISEQDVAIEGNDTLTIGERWSFKSLRDHVLVSSSNDGASAIASVAGSALSNSSPTLDSKTKFIAEMNAEAEALGLTSTHFYNESGLDQHGRAGAYGSASDMAKLFEYVLENYPLILEPTKEESFYATSIDGLQHTTQNTNTIVGQLPNLIASKTGYTEEAGGNLAVIVDAGLSDPIAIVVLGSTIDGRFNDVQMLANEFVIKDIKSN